MRVISCAVFLFASILPGPSSLAQEAASTAEDRMLRGQGIATDGPGLLSFLRAQTPSAEEQARLAGAVERLGHRSFAVRERASKTLVAAGRPSLPFLRPALAHPDLEVARRAERGMDDIERISHTALLSAAVRVLAERRPAGATEALLEYLPFVPNGAVEEAVREALVTIALGYGEPPPAIRAALNDRNSRLRMAAAFVLGRSAAPRAKDVSLLLRDPIPEVRLFAAEAVLRHRDRAGVGVLLALLEDGPGTTARQAEELLFHLAGDSAPTQALSQDDPAERRRCREAWLSWWTANESKTDLGRLHATAVPLGVTLYCLYDSISGDGRVLLAGPDGKTRWEIDGLQGPNDARLLPGGRVLVAERNAGRVTERDTAGRILWEKRVESGALSAQRLPGGNTLIASWTQLLEAAPDGKTVWEYTNPAGFRHAGYQKNGRVLALTAGGQLLEFDRSGKIVRSLMPERHGGGATYWGSAELAAGGRYLAALGSSKRVVELEENGKIAWEIEVPNAVFAARLANGNTLVCSFEECEVVEVDREGKQVAKRKLAGRPFTARRY